MRELRTMALLATALTAGAAVLASSGAAHATLIKYGASGTDPASEPIAAEADFTTGTGVIDVTLTNTLAPSALRSAGQSLSDLVFTLSNAPGAQGTLSAAGQLGNITGTTPGTVAFTTGSPGRFIGQGGGAFSVSSNTITMEALGGGMPSEVILPAVANGGQYANSNASLTNFNPTTIGPATFVLDFAGVTASTTITAATFSFGTTAGADTLPGVVIPTSGVPEPASLALLGTALAGLGFFGFRRRRQS